ncbi:IS110 family transposase [Methyloterricola oryzae]|uniref:IS110 family transposase n=1 Tax=Methyloterricola oryzae TaxID=1495050 RepID=UPI000699439E
MAPQFDKASFRTGRLRPIRFEGCWRNGVVIPRGIHSLLKRIPELLEDDESGLDDRLRSTLYRLWQHLTDLDRQVRELEAEIVAWHQASDASRQLARVPGIGPIIATDVIATIGDGRQFESRRNLAAWLGLVPRQNSTGGRATLQGISKRGDR